MYAYLVWISSELVEVEVAMMKMTSQEGILTTEGNRLTKWRTRPPTRPQWWRGEENREQKRLVEPQNPPFIYTIINPIYLLVLISFSFDMKYQACLDLQAYQENAPWKCSVWPISITNTHNSAVLGIWVQFNFNQLRNTWSSIFGFIIFRATVCMAIQLSQSRKGAETSENLEIIQVFKCTASHKIHILFVNKYCL